MEDIFLTNQLSQKDIEVTTTEEFITILLEREKNIVRLGTEKLCCDNMQYALQRGIAEHCDIVNASKAIERRAAARIVHNLLLELGEKDEKNWSAAKKLLDLYHCRTCVIHIAQVYAKGIMKEANDELFQPEMLLSKLEAENIAKRTFDKNARIPKIENSAVDFRVLSFIEVEQLLKDDSKSMLIDVRSSEEYEAGHIKGSISIPVREIIKNPFIVCEKKNTVIIFYCQRGYQSKLAAQLLVAADYNNVFIMPYLTSCD